MVLYSLPGKKDEIRNKLYQVFLRTPTQQEREQGAAELSTRSKNFKYEGEPMVAQFELSRSKPVIDYFRQFPGLDASTKNNNAGFWGISPIPVTSDVDVHPDD